jgi:hypothetical protein
MTKEDSAIILRYAMSIYPSLRMTEDELQQAAIIWSKEFAHNTKEQVIEAFKIARENSPVWMPAIPAIQDAIISINMRLKRKSDEEEFRDKHCGKSESEWREYKKWEQSPEGKERIMSYKRRLAEILND